MDSDTDLNLQSEETLHPRIIIYWTGLVLLLSVVPSSVLIPLSFSYSFIPFWTGPAVTVLLIFIGTAYAIKKYRVWSFQLHEDGISIHRGVIIKVDTFVPYVRVQHVDTRRGPIERVLGLASVIIYTAGSRGADVRIPGLLHPRASRLQEQLRTIIEEEESVLEDAV